MDAAPSRLPGSRDHVHARLNEVGKGDAASLVVQLSIDAGWHVNANPASFEFLIPTRVELPVGWGPAEIRYPPGQVFQPEFASTVIRVYEGRVEIPVLLPSRRSRPAELVVHFQACDRSRCLPPDRSVLVVGAPI
jgi:hypothetical protein